MNFGVYPCSIASDQADPDYNNLVVKSETSEEEAMPVPGKFRISFHFDVGTLIPILFPEHLMDHRLRYKNLKKKFKFLVYVS